VQQVGGQPLQLPMPETLNAGWAQQKHLKTVVCQKTAEQKAMIEISTSTYDCCHGAQPSQEEQVAQVNAVYPKEKQLKRLQVSQYFMSCLRRMRKQAADTDL
jgi:hypothetical protein